MSKYVDITYYKNTYKGTVIPEDELERRLEDASLHIDTLTYNRIVGRGFENLSNFQKDIIKKVTCRLADFECENEDIIKSVLSSYSINGVSVNLSNSNNVYMQNGAIISKNDYALLKQTGLTCKNLRY